MRLCLTSCLLVVVLSAMALPVEAELTFRDGLVWGKVEGSVQEIMAELSSRCGFELIMATRSRKRVQLDFQGVPAREAVAALGKAARVMATWRARSTAQPSDQVVVRDLKVAVDVVKRADVYWAPSALPYPVFVVGADKPHPLAGRRKPGDPEAELQPTQAAAIVGLVLAEYAAKRRAYEAVLVAASAPAYLPRMPGPEQVRVYVDLQRGEWFATLLLQLDAERVGEIVYQLRNQEGDVRRSYVVIRSVRPSTPPR